jgi:hypothetical protein
VKGGRRLGFVRYGVCKWTEARPTLTGGEGMGGGGGWGERVTSCSALCCVRRVLFQPGVFHGVGTWGGRQRHTRDTPEIRQGRRPGRGPALGSKVQQSRLLAVLPGWRGHGGMGGWRALCSIATSPEARRGEREREREATDTPSRSRYLCSRLHDGGWGDTRRGHGGFSMNASSSSYSCFF